MEHLEIPAVLTIAGSDSSGGAGIQADLKTMAAHDVYGMSVITSVTAQNTCGVTAIENMSGEMIRAQLDAVFEDIFPAAVKVGMLSTKEAVQAVAEAFKKYQPKHVVLDPVMVATSGSRLIENETVPYMLEELFPLAELVTPNLSEAEVILKLQPEEALAGFDKEKPLSEQIAATEADAERAADIIHQRYGCQVLLKGGHSKKDADDLLYIGAPIWYPGERIDTKNTHGTGCTLSSAIACQLVLGHPLPEAVGKAKSYVVGALSAGLDLGKGCGPLYHNYRHDL